MSVVADTSELAENAATETMTVAGEAVTLVHCVAARNDSPRARHALPQLAWIDVTELVPIRELVRTSSRRFAGTVTE
jgi:hypothetical protein